MSQERNATHTFAEIAGGPPSIEKQCYFCFFSCLYSTNADRLSITFYDFVVLLRSQTLATSSGGRVLIVYLGGVG